MRTILVLGGYGYTGRLLARYVLQETDCHAIVAGRSADKAQALAEELNGQFEGERARGMALDATNTEALMAAFSDIDWVILTTSTSHHVGPVARCAIDSGIDYLDVQFSKHKTAVLEEMREDIERAGLCFISEGGFHPGLPAALVRYAAEKLDTVEVANVGAAVNLGVVEGEGEIPESVYEFVEFFKEFEQATYRCGEWKKDRRSRTFDFESFGKRKCQPWKLQEMLALPGTYPSLKEVGLYVAGMNWYVDWFAIPVTMMTLWVAPRRGVKPMARLFVWGLKKFSKPPYFAALKLDASGQREGRAEEVSLLVHADDEYELTAIPVVACLLQVLDGTARKPGLHLMGQVPEPVRLVDDIERMGVTVVRGSGS